MFEHSPLREKYVPESESHDAPLPEIPERGPLTNAYEVACSTWEQLGVEDSVAELAELLGQREIFSPNYPLASNRGFNYHNDPPAHIPGLVKLGATLYDCDVPVPLSGANIAAVKGKLLLYRTQQAEDTVPRYKNIYSDRPELYHEGGFFCFVIAEIDPATEAVVPSVVYGDINTAAWKRQALKLHTALMLSNYEATVEYHNKLSESWPEAQTQLEAMLFGHSLKGKFRQRYQHGVFLQNKEPFVDGVDAIYETQRRIRASMQYFIDTRSHPEQITTTDEVQPTVPRPEYKLPGWIAVGFDKKLEYFNRNWAEIQIREQRRLPLVEVIGKTAVDWYSSDGLHGPTDRALGQLLRGLPPKKLRRELERTSLSDEEIMKIHALEPRTSGHTQAGKMHTYISPLWKYYLEAYPHLYPGVTEESIRAKAQS